MVKLDFFSSTVFRDNKVCSSKLMVMVLLRGEVNICHAITYFTERVLMEPVTTIRMEMKILNWFESVLHILLLESQARVDVNKVLFTV